MTFQKLEINCKEEMHKQTDLLTHRQTDGLKKELKSKTETLLSMLVPQILSICIVH